MISNRDLSAKGKRDLTGKELENKEGKGVFLFCELINLQSNNLLCFDYDIFKHPSKPFMTMPLEWTMSFIPHPMIGKTDSKETAHQEPSRISLD